MAEDGFLASLEASAVGEAMRHSLWLYPAVETLHIIGFSILIGSIVAFDIRVLGLGRGIPVDRAGRFLLPLALSGFALAVPMGMLLFTTEATSIAENPSFRIKMALLVLAGLNAVLFHVGPWRNIASWAGGTAPLAARCSAAGSAVLWIGVLMGGRLIAYF